MALNPLDQINPITVVGIMIIFTVTYFILRKTLFLPVVQVMDNRAKKIKSGRATIARAEFLLCDAQGKAERILTEAQEEAERITEESKKETAGLKEQDIAQANKKADAILFKEQKEIRLLKQTEQDKLEQGLIYCVSKTLKKSIGYTDEKVILSMITKVLATRGNGEGTLNG